MSAQGACVRGFFGKLSDLERAGTVLGSLVKDLGLESALALYRIRENWESVFRGPLSLHSSPSGLSRGRLLVNVDSPAWLQQLNFYRKDVVRKLASFGVKDVRFKLGRVRPLSQRRTAPAPVEDSLIDNDRAFIEEVVSGVDDRDLGENIRGAMRSWAIKGRRPR
jgi:hypothetical protein